MRSIASRISPSLVISLIALVLAASGTSLASVPLGALARTLGLSSKQKKQVITLANKQIAKKAPKLSVLFARSAAKASSAVTAIDAVNTTNAIRAASATTAGTATAANSLNGVQIVHGPTAANPKGSASAQTVPCPSGKHAISGGVVDNGGSSQAIVREFISSTGAAASETNNAFTGEVSNTSAEEFTFNVWVLCATAEVSGSSF